MKHTTYTNLPSGQIQFSQTKPTGFPCPNTSNDDWGLLQLTDTTPNVLVGDTVGRDPESGPWTRILVGADPAEHPEMHPVSVSDWYDPLTNIYLWDFEEIIQRRGVGLHVRSFDGEDLDLMPGQWCWRKSMDGVAATYDGRWIGPVRGLRSVDRLMEWSAPPELVVPAYRTHPDEPVGQVLARLLFEMSVEWVPSGDPLVEIPLGFGYEEIRTIDGPIDMSGYRSGTFDFAAMSGRWRSCLVAVCEVVLCADRDEWSVLKDVLRIYRDVLRLYPDTKLPDGSDPKNLSRSDVHIRSAVAPVREPERAESQPGRKVIPGSDAWKLFADKLIPKRNTRRVCSVPHCREVPVSDGMCVRHLESTKDPVRDAIRALSERKSN